MTRIKRIGKQSVRYLKSQDFQVGQEVNGVEHMEDLGAVYKATSQDIETLNSAGYDKDAFSLIKSVSPFPATILGIVVDIDVTETK